MSYGWDYADRSFFILTPFTYYDAFMIPPCLSTADSSILLSTAHYSTVQIYHSLFIQSPTEGHLGGSQVLVIMNKAAVNIHVRFFGWT